MIKLKTLVCLACAIATATNHRINTITQIARSALLIPKEILSKPLLLLNSRTLKFYSETLTETLLIFQFFLMRPLRHRREIM